MRTPTIHLNGTAGEVLLANAKEARRAVLVAIEAVNKAAPHARDYYPQGEHAFPAAQDSHRSMIHNLERIERELSELVFSVFDAQPWRTSR